MFATRSPCTYMKKHRFWIVTATALVVYFAARWLYMRPGVHGGDTAPQIEAMLADGSAWKLDDMRGTYVILDFWGSWCGPCIRDIPAMKELYARYRDIRFSGGNGLEIVGIAVESDSLRWQKALAHYDFPWRYHVLDPTSSLRFFNGPLAKRFGVRRLPAFFLIDSNGKVVGSGTTPAQIESLLLRSVPRENPR